MHKTYAKSLTLYTNTETLHNSTKNTKSTTLHKTSDKIQNFTKNTKTRQNFTT